MFGILQRRMPGLFRTREPVAAAKLDLLSAMGKRDLGAANALLAESADASRVSVEFDSNLSAGPTVPCWTASGRRSVFSFDDRPSAVAEVIFGRWFDFLPLALRTMERPAAQGRCLVNLGDEGVAPGLAFCGVRPEYDLIPDSSFLSTAGYADLVKIFTESPTPFSQRAPVAFWRGASTGIRTGDVLDLPRVRLCLIAQRLMHKADAGITSLVHMQSNEEGEKLKHLGILADYVPAALMQNYQIHIDIDGNSNSWPGLLTKLHTGSPVIKVESLFGFRQWYYDRLIPWDNFVPVNSDMLDLEEKIDLLLDNPKRAEEIGRRGQALALQMTFEREVDLAASVASSALRRGKPPVSAAPTVR